MRYAVVCHGGMPVAYVDVSAKLGVKITPANHAPHMTIAHVPIVNGVPAWTHEHIFADSVAHAAERQVTEIRWTNGRSWVIRCGEGQCSAQVEIADRNFPAIANWLADQQWMEVDGMRVVPLGVLVIKMTHLNV